MAERLSILWRGLAAGICFATFGLGGLMLRLIAFPLVSLFSRCDGGRQLRARSLIRLSFGFFVGMMRRIGVLSYELHGIERLDRSGLLIVANHPTLIDVVFLMSLVRNADCVVKAGLWRNPFTKGPVCAARFVRNDSGTRMLDACTASLRAGSNLIIFPEGTRSVPGKKAAFQRGSANIAVRGGFPLTPVTIRCSPPFLTKGEKWYRAPRRRPHFVFSVGPDIPIQPYLQPGGEALAVRRLTHDLELHFAQELSSHG